MILGDYLTTEGISAKDDIQMARDLGLGISTNYV